MFFTRRNFLSFLPAISSFFGFGNKSPAHLNDVKYFVNGEWISTYRIWDFRSGYVFVFSWNDDKFLFPLAITFFGIFREPETRQPLLDSYIYYYNEKTNVRKENKKEKGRIVGRVKFQEQLLVDIVNCNRHSSPQPWTVAGNINFNEEADALREFGDKL